MRLDGGTIAPSVAAGLSWTGHAGVAIQPAAAAVVTWKQQFWPDANVSHESAVKLAKVPFRIIHRHHCEASTYARNE